MSWHNLTIEKIFSRLNFLKNVTRIITNHGNQTGSDIEIYFQQNGQERKINIEIQQFDSGTPWTRNTIPSWERRHDLATLIIFTEPTLERVLKPKNNNKAVYQFFKKKDVFLFHDKQLEDVVSLIITLCMK